MIAVGDEAPRFSAPVANGDVGTFELDERLEEAPLVLAFVPAAFTGTCTKELCTFETNLSAFDDFGASVYGVSVDSPFALNEWREREGISFGLISDFEKEIIEEFGVRTSFEELGVHGLAQRSVFVLDGDGTVTYRWVADHPGQEPDYEAVENAVAETAT